MTHPAPDARTPRPAAEYRWTDNKAFAFLQALAQHGKVAAAARAVGMTRQSAYRLKRRVPAIAEPWARARAIGQARRRAGPHKASPCAMQGDTSGIAR
jgi:molybdenum-dependent DNA-binding transcriptional regulator ModE